MNNPKLLILFSIILLTACGPAPAATSAPATETVLPTRQVTPMPTSTPTYKPSPTMTITMTPMSTLSAIDAENELLEVLRNNGGCSFPCFWGFTPGISKAESFYSFMYKFIEISPYIDMTIPRDDIALYVNPYAQGGYRGDSETISWISIDLRVRQKVKSIEIPYGDPYYSDYFKYYTLPYLLTTYGPPEQAYVFLDTGIADMGLGIDLYLLHLDYSKQGWVAHLQMPLWHIKNKFVGCPSEALTSLRLWSPDFPARDYELTPSDLFTIEEATGMTVEEFYQKFKDPANTDCLETPSDIHK
jgi:hypothetical protein